MRTARSELDRFLEMSREALAGIGRKLNRSDEIVMRAAFAAGVKAGCSLTIDRVMRPDGECPCCAIEAQAEEITDEAAGMVAEMAREN